MKRIAIICGQAFHLGGDMFWRNPESRVNTGQEPATEHEEDCKTTSFRETGRATLRFVHVVSWLSGRVNKL